MNTEPSVGSMAQRLLPPVTIHPLSSFGVQLTAHRPSSVIDLDVEWLRALLMRHKIVALRGFQGLDRNHFITAARRFGSLLEWEYGYVLDIAAGEPSRENMRQGDAACLHWDRGFARPIPGLLFFQCLEACDGEITFCDTNSVIAGAPQADLAAWCAMEIVYHRETTTRHGNEKRWRLIDQHPATGESILRFDEPAPAGAGDSGLASFDFASLDLSSIEIRLDSETLSETEVRRFLAGFIPRLHQEAVSYIHHWREGDFLLADNYALLHGRRDFAEGRCGRLQRIHIL